MYVCSEYGFKTDRKEAGGGGFCGSMLMKKEFCMEKHCDFLESRIINVSMHFDRMRYARFAQNIVNFDRQQLCVLNSNK